jgi:hypothetical protein
LYGSSGNVSNEQSSSLNLAAIDCQIFSDDLVYSISLKDISPFFDQLSDQQIIKIKETEYKYCNNQTNSDLGDLLFYLVSNKYQPAIDLQNYCLDMECDYWIEVNQQRAKIYLIDHRPTLTDQLIV